MGRIIGKIFEQAELSVEWKEMNRVLDRAVENDLRLIKEKFPDSDYEKIRDVVYAAMHDAQKKAFREGFQYAVRLWTESLMEED